MNSLPYFTAAEIGIPGLPSTILTSHHVRKHALHTNASFASRSCSLLRKLLSEQTARNAARTTKIASFNALAPCSVPAAPSCVLRNGTPCSIISTRYAYKSPRFHHATAIATQSPTNPRM